MNLIDQVFAQQSSGSAEGQGFGQFFAEGVAQGQRQQQLNMELATLPLKQTLLQQDAQMNALRIDQGLKARQDDIEATDAFTGLAGQVTPLLKTGKLDDAILAFTEGGLNNNVLLTDRRYQAMGKQLDDMSREAKLAEYRKGLVEARKDAAKGSELRYLPAGVKIDRLLQQAQSDLATAQSEDGFDPVLAKDAQDRITSLTAQKQMEADKLKVQQDRVVNDAERVKATKERTAAIKANTQALLQRLAGNDKIALTSELRTVDDQPNSKMDYEAKLKEKERILEKYKTRAQTQTAPAQTTAPIAPPTSVPPSGEQIIVIDRRPNSPTLGKKFKIDLNDQERAVREGFEVLP